MPTVTLFSKAYGNVRMGDFERNLKSTLEGLNVEAKICGVTERGWVQVSVCGEDENAALRYLEEKIGLCPANVDVIGKFSTIRGRVTGLRKSGNELRVDIGVFSPSVYDAVVPLSRVQAQLADGMRVPLQKVVDAFGLCENMPLTVKITGVKRENGLVRAEVAEEQRRLYVQWAESMLDRLLILGASLSAVRLAVKRGGFGRDVVSVDPLGSFEHSVVCKLGTDAVGLIPRIGRELGNASLAVFSPRRVYGFFGNPSQLPISE